MDFLTNCSDNTLLMIIFLMCLCFIFAAGDFIASRIEKRQREKDCAELRKLFNYRL
jgi:hypothetical protein